MIYKFYDVNIFRLYFISKMAHNYRKVILPFVFKNISILMYLYFFGFLDNSNFHRNILTFVFKNISNFNVFNIFRIFRY